MHSHTHVCVHTHNGISFSHKKKEIFLFATTWMNPEGTVLSKINQTEKRQIPYVEYLYKYFYVEY